MPDGQNIIKKLESFKVMKNAMKFDVSREDLLDLINDKSFDYPVIKDLSFASVQFGVGSPEIKDGEIHFRDCRFVGCSIYTDSFKEWTFEGCVFVDCNIHIGKDNEVVFYISNLGNSQIYLWKTIECQYTKISPANFKYDFVSGEVTPRFIDSFTGEEIELTNTSNSYFEVIHRICNNVARLKMMNFDSDYDEIFPISSVVDNLGYSIRVDEMLFIINAYSRSNGGNSLDREEMIQLMDKFFKLNYTYKYRIVDDIITIEMNGECNADIDNKLFITFDKDFTLEGR